MDFSSAIHRGRVITELTTTVTSNTVAMATRMMSLVRRVSGCSKLPETAMSRPSTRIFQDPSRSDRSVDNLTGYLLRRNDGPSISVVLPLDVLPIGVHTERMALQPVIRRSVPEEVFEQVATDVLSGEMQPGAALPSERRMAEVLGVSRPAVREALKRLSAAGLIEVRQGDVTTVRDF